MAEPVILQVRRGEQLKLSFNEASGAGFQWTYEAAPGLKVSEDAAAPDSGEDIGSDTVAGFTVTALRPGTHNVEFQLKRPWETEARETRSYTIVVQP